MTEVHLSNCTGKQRYEFSRAEKVAKRMRRSCSEPVNHYRCKGCGYWHVGTPAQPLHSKGKVLK